jgi:regulator of sirC expression with transglutaminase-like and TPR domain
VLLIARSEYPDFDASVFGRVLDEYAAVLAPRLLGVSSVDESVRRVSAFLFGDVGFRGNAKEYYDPENSYLNRVLERRLGIPITLATVFLLVARRLGLPVHGVGLPQHFILKFRGKDGEVFMDPFGGGKFLGVKDCARYLSEKHVPFLDAYLRAVTDGEILTRMLGNLLRIYIAQDDQSRCDRVSGMLKALV